MTRPDVIDYHRLSRFLNAHFESSAAALDEAATAAGLTPVTIDATPGAAGGRASKTGTVSAWADPAALAVAGAAGPERHRVTLLSPFDSLIWDRKRTLRMFGFEHSLEAYVPKDKRIHGYFTMPLLAGGQLVGRVDPAREGATLIGRKVSLTRASAAEPMAQALREAASWVGCDDVRLEQVEPAVHASRLAAALAHN